MADTLKEAIATYQRKHEAAADVEERRRAEADFIADSNRLFLEDMKERFLNGPRNPRADLDRGGSIALFQAVDFCGRMKIPMPAWVSTAFSEGYHRVVWADVATWDQAFGRPWPLHTVLEAVRRRQQMMTEIYLRVLALHGGRDGAPPRPIDNELFEKVGKEFGIKRSLCSKLYRHERRRIGDLPNVVRMPRQL